MVMKKEMQSKEHARREEEAAAEQDLELQDRSLFADLNKEEAQPERPPEAIPGARRLMHLLFAPWCEFCTSGKARQDHPRP